MAVEESNSRTEHTVTLDEEYYARLTDRKISKEELINARASKKYKTDVYSKLY